MRKIITIGVLYLSLLFIPASQAATDLASLTDDARNAINQLCSPVQYREGATAYRRCVQSEIESVQQNGTSQLSKLGFDEKYAVQQFCASAGDSHKSCISNQIASVRNIPTPSMSNIMEDEQYAIQQSCFPAQSKQGLLAYRQCVVNEVASLQQLPRISLNSLPLLKRNALQLRCSANSQSAASYRQCLAVEYASFSNAAPTYETTAITTTSSKAVTPPQTLSPPVSTQVAASTQQPNTQLVTSTNKLPTSNTRPRNIDPQRATQTSVAAQQIDPVSTPTPTASSLVTAQDALTPVTESRVITKPDLVEQVAQIETTTVDAPIAAPGDGLINLFSNATETIKVKFDALTTLGKALAGLVVAIPFLFFAIKRLVAQRRQNQEWDIDYQTQPIPGRINTNNNTEAIKARWDDDFLKEDLTLPTEPYRAEREIQLEDDFTDTAPATRIVQRPQQEIDAKPRKALWQSGFGLWIESEPAGERQQHCTEFLIYWMAYGDERYEKDLKERIFTTPNPSSHDLIKRWVLKPDVFAFADAINWLKRNSSKAQQEQIIDLLMALLVTENNVSPNQNIILRMLADSFGIGTNALQERFLEAYAQSLPAFPRTDKQSWWLDQSPDSVTRWDAREMATLSDDEQMLSRLGLSDNYSEQDVVKAFRRASKRCHPDRFSLLGDWEMKLAQRQFEKFEEARDWLLEVSA